MNVSDECGCHAELLLPDTGRIPRRDHDVLAMNYLAASCEVVTAILFLFQRSKPREIYSKRLKCRLLICL